MNRTFITFDKTTGKILSEGDVPEPDLPQETETVGVKVTYARIYNHEAFTVIAGHIVRKQAN